MAQVANTHATYNSNRNREMLFNEIWNVSVSDAPFTRLIGKESITSTFPEWLTDVYAAASINKVEQGNQSTVVAVTQPTRLSNRTQISEKVFGVTGTQDATEKAGKKSESNYQLSKAMIVLKKDVEMGCLQNTTAVTAASGVAPQARGLFGFIDTNVSFGTGGVKASPTTNTAAVDGATRPFTEALLKSVNQTMFDNGVDLTQTYALLPSSQRTVFDGFLAGTTRFDKAEDKELTATLEVYIGPFGRVKTVNARHMRQREVAIISPEFLSLGMLRSMKDTELAKIGDVANTLVNCEWTLLVKNTVAHAGILDLA